MCRLSWFLDPGGWGKAAAVGLYFIFPGICTPSLPYLVYNMYKLSMKGSGFVSQVCSFPSPDKCDSVDKRYQDVTLSFCFHAMSAATLPPTPFDDIMDQPSET
ncbi:hypothetical protein STEG23_018647 [Scotinomys teguina]